MAVTSDRAAPAADGKVSASVRGTDFTVDQRYAIQKFVGCGSYGVLVAAIYKVVSCIVQTSYYYILAEAVY